MITIINLHLRLFQAIIRIITVMGRVSTATSQTNHVEGSTEVAASLDQNVIMSINAAIATNMDMEFYIAGN